MEIRINRYISMCGIGPRRYVSEELRNGKFIVNGKIAEVGQMLDIAKDTVSYNGKEIRVKDKMIYMAVNKPEGYVSTLKDEMNRNTVMELVDCKERLYPIGRLDKNSTGLILLTNDGDLALKLTHPKYHLPKKYIVTTVKNVSDDQLNKFAKGIKIGDTITLPADVTRIGENIFEAVLYQGMKRQIREMCRTLGLHVYKLHRIQIGNVKIGNLKSGESRNLTPEEVLGLKNILARKAIKEFGIKVKK